MGRGGAAFLAAAFSLVPKWVFQQISGLKPLRTAGLQQGGAE